MDKDELEKIVLEKLAEIAAETFATLTIAEGRSEHEIEVCLQAIDDDMSNAGYSGGDDEGLLETWKMFREDSMSFTNHPEGIADALQIEVDPPLESTEYALLVGLYLARAGISRVVDNQPKQHLLAALLLTDAVEAHCYWKAIRGQTGCRNPEHRLLQAEQTLQRRISESFVRDKLSESAKRAADARHDKPGASRDNKEKIRSIWASGKYTSRDICAEQECAALGISYSTARRALRNTLDPT
jgi:hypothetical protein